MRGIFGSIMRIAKYDKINVVELVKDADGISVVVTCVKDRQGTALGARELMYKILNSSSTYYTCAIQVRRSICVSLG